ncbi:hypothetical protein BJ742DRAFT_135522 [Cladochytrium replicatum]|nr:hypothetical protein BJ742DRAFT_135522 [Cladochytrium replicatum]
MDPTRPWGQAPLRVVQLPLPILAHQAAPAAEYAEKPSYAFAPASGSKGKATVKKYDRISSMDVVGAEEELSSATPDVLTYLFVGSFGAIPLVPELQPLRVSPRVYIFPLDDDTTGSANPVTWGAENSSGRMLFRVEFPESVDGSVLLAFERLLARLTVYTSPWVYSSDEAQAERLSEGADLIEYLRDEQLATLAQYQNSLCLMDDKVRIIGVMDSGLPVLYGNYGHDAGALGAKEAVVVDVLAEEDDFSDSDNEEMTKIEQLPRRSHAGPKLWQSLTNHLQLLIVQTQLLLSQNDRVVLRLSLRLRLRQHLNI